MLARERCLAGIFVCALSPALGCAGSTGGPNGRGAAAGSPQSPGTVPISSSSSVSLPSVLPAPGSQLPDGAIGAVYTLTFALYGGGVPPFTFAPHAALPPGLAIVAVDGQSFALAGTPSLGFNGTVAVDITDATGATEEADFQLLVPAPPISLSPLSVPDGFENNPYQITFSTTGTPPFQWTTSFAPPGLAFGSSSASTLDLSGVPNQTGGFGFTVTVTDAQGATATQSYILTIN